MSETVEALIVGMGPAGMAAAIELAKCGVEFAIIDENPSPGGQAFRQPIPRIDRVAGMPLPHPGHGEAHKLIDAFKTAVKTRGKIYSDTYVWGAFQDNTLSLLNDAGIFSIKFRKLLLCEGAMERPLPFPGWTLPGIMTVGGLKKLILQDHCLPGKKIMLAGCSPLLIPTAATIVRAGGKVLAIADAVAPDRYPKLALQLIKRRKVVAEALQAFLSIFGARIPILRSTAAISAAGDTRLESVRVAKLDRNGNFIRGSEQLFDVDILGVSGGFIPSSRLARLMGCEHFYDEQHCCWRPKVNTNYLTSQENVYVAGDGSGIAGREAAQIRGYLAASHIAVSLNRLTQSGADKKNERIERELSRIMNYANALNRTFLPVHGLYNTMAPSTIVCRCEQVTVGDIINGIEKGYRNINEIKRTRVGMGPCQGRSCEWATAQIMLHRGIPIEEIGYFNLRPPLSPIPFSIFEDFAQSHAVN